MQLREGRLCHVSGLATTPCRCKFGWLVSQDSTVSPRSSHVFVGGPGSSHPPLASGSRRRADVCSSTAALPRWACPGPPSQAPADEENGDIVPDCHKRRMFMVQAPPQSCRHALAQALRQRHAQPARGSPGPRRQARCPPPKAPPRAPPCREPRTLDASFFARSPAKVARGPQVRERGGRARRQARQNGHMRLQRCNFNARGARGDAHGKGSHAKAGRARNGPSRGCDRSPIE